MQLTPQTSNPRPKSGDKTLILPKTIVEANSIIEAKKLDDVAVKLLETGAYHPCEPDESIPGTPDARARRLLYEVENKLSKISAYLSEIQVYDPLMLKNVEYRVERGKSWVQIAEEETRAFAPIEEKLDKVIERIRKAREVLRELEEIRASLEPLKDLDISLDRIESTKMLFISLGFIEAELLSKLEAGARELKHYALLTHKVSDKKVLVLLITVAEEKQRALQALRDSGFQPLSIPEGLPRNPSEAYRVVVSEINRFAEEIRKAREEIRSKSDELMLKYNVFYTIREALRVIATAKVKGRLAFLRGYIVEGEEEKVANAVKDACREACVLTLGGKVRGAKEVRVPTSYKVPKLLKPFHSIVEDYGTPAPNEIVPTLFLAVTFPLLYGFMFPDAGHALAIILFGLFMIHTARGREGRRNIGLLATYLGTAAFIIGFLSGEFFGPLVPFREVVWKGHSPITPPIEMEGGGNIMFMITVSLRIAAIMLITGVLMGVINSLLAREYKDALLVRVPKAIMFTSATYPFLIWSASRAGHVIYDAVLGGAVSIEAKIVRYGFLLGLLALLLLEPLYDAIKHGAKHFVGKLGIMLLEVYDTLIMVVGNTASFMRILGLSLAHAGLMIGFGELALMVMGGGGIVRLLCGVIVYIIGNLLTIGLEGIVVYAHTLRLHYYEWFTKFYSGTGVPFRPVRQAARIVFVT